MSNEKLRADIQNALTGVPENSYLGELLNRCYVALGEQAAQPQTNDKGFNELKQDVCTLNMEVEQLKAQRDELVEALADAVDYLNGPMNSIHHGSRLYSQMGEALACIEDVKP